MSEKIQETVAVENTKPGYNLGIAGFIVTFFASVIGLIMSIIAYRQSRAAGIKNGFAVAGIITGSVFTIIGAVSSVLFLLLAMTPPATY